MSGIEPAKAPLKIHYMYVIKTTVAHVEGEWVRFSGSQEKMLFGEHDFVEGDKVRITFSHA